MYLLPYSRNPLLQADSSSRLPPLTSATIATTTLKTGTSTRTPLPQLLSPAQAHHIYTLTYTFPFDHEQSHSSTSTPTPTGIDTPTTYIGPSPPVLAAIICLAILILILIFAIMQSRQKYIRKKYLKAHAALLRGTEGGNGADGRTSRLSYSHTYPSHGVPGGAGIRSGSMAELGNVENNPRGRDLRRASVAGGSSLTFSEPDWRAMGVARRGGESESNNRVTSLATAEPLSSGPSSALTHHRGNSLPYTLSSIPRCSPVSEHYSAEISLSNKPIAVVATTPKMYHLPPVSLPSPIRVSGIILQAAPRSRDPEGRLSSPMWMIEAGPGNEAEVLSSKEGKEVTEEVMKNVYRDSFDHDLPEGVVGCGVSLEGGKEDDDDDDDDDVDNSLAGSTISNSTNRLYLTLLPFYPTDSCPPSPLYNPPSPAHTSSSGSGPYFCPSPPLPSPPYWMNFRYDPATLMQISQHEAARKLAYRTHLLSHAEHSENSPCPSRCSDPFHESEYSSSIRSSTPSATSDAPRPARKPRPGYLLREFESRPAVPASEFSFGRTETVAYIGPPRNFRKEAEEEAEIIVAHRRLKREKEEAAAERIARGELPEEEPFNSTRPLGEPDRVVKNWLTAEALLALEAETEQKEFWLTRDDFWGSDEGEEEAREKERLQKISSRFDLFCLADDSSSSDAGSDESLSRKTAIRKTTTITVTEEPVEEPVIMVEKQTPASEDRGYASEEAVSGLIHDSS